LNKTTSYTAPATPAARRFSKNNAFTTRIDIKVSLSPKSINDVIMGFNIGEHN
jgi:hypothetical protein